MKRKLLFVNQSQFGYHIDYRQYCKYLKKDFEITYLCWDYKKEKIKESGINVLYVSRDNNIIKRNIRFIKKVVNLSNQKNFSIIFIHFFRGSFIIPLLNSKQQKIHLDVRTGSCSPNTFSRITYNAVLRFESMFFRSHSIISVGLRQKLGINQSAYILPLGANPIYVKRQLKNKLSLIYVGTLTSRRIEDTIEGIKLFLKMLPKADIFYTIVGDGWQNETQNLQNLIIRHGLQEYIELSGYVIHDKLTQFFQRANAGVSYIPITPYYEYQPATKTFEYLMAGIPVIATKTAENKRIVSKLNGILIKDTPESFANGIKILYENINSFNEHVIRKSVKNYEWSQIIGNMKETILK